MTGGDLPFQPGDDPFANLPLFGDLAKALSGQGPLNWDAARQFAALASGDRKSTRLNSSHSQQSRMPSSA